MDSLATRCATCARLAYDVAGGPLEPDGQMTADGWVCCYCRPDHFAGAGNMMVAEPFGPIWAEMPKHEIEQLQVDAGKYRAMVNNAVLQLVKK